MVVALKLVSQAYGALEALIDALPTTSKVWLEKQHEMAAMDRRMDERLARHQ